MLYKAALCVVEMLRARGKSVKIIKNEVGCRDDTVPKTEEALLSLALARMYYMYIRTHVLDLSEKLRMCKIKLVTRKWRRILRKFPKLTKLPSEKVQIVCLHQRIMYDP